MRMRRIRDPRGTRKTQETRAFSEAVSGFVGSNRREDVEVDDGVEPVAGGRGGAHCKVGQGLLLPGMASGPPVFSSFTTGEE